MNPSRIPTLLLPLILCFLLSGHDGLFALDPQWTRVLSGSLVGRPAVQGERVFALTDDRAVTCLNASGSFLWSRPVRGRPARYLSVADNGLVQTVSSNGMLTTMSRDGVLLWTMQFDSEPSCPPLRGRDGRTVFLFSDRALCLTDTGRVLWQLRLERKKVQNIAQTGNGYFLLYGNTGTVLLVSPFGRVLAEIELEGEPLVFAPVPSGFVVALSEKKISFHDVRSGKNGYRIECLWTIGEDSPIVNVSEKDGTLYVALQNGSVIARNVTDASVLWSCSTGSGFSGSVYMDFSYSRISVLSSGSAVSLDERGKRVWLHALPGIVGTGVLGPDGMIYGAASGWNLAAWRAEARILSRKDSIKSGTYGILELSFPGYAYMNTSDQMFSFLNRVETSLNEGTLGESEPLFARWLVDIIEGSFTDPFSDKKPDSTTRGRAASLLGKFGTEEYRPVLLAAANGPFDESFAIGLIHGLSRLGIDQSGESVGAVASLARRSGLDRPAMQYAACDALYSLARYSSGSVRDDAVRILVSFSAEPWNDQVRNYARKALEALLQY